MTLKAIGITFATELNAAGLLGLPFSWGSDGVIQFDPRMTQPQRDAVLAVYAAHDPTKPDPSPRPYDFRVALPSIFTGTGAEKLERMFALRQLVPGLTEPFLQAIRGPELGDEESAWVQRIAAEVQARIGLATEVLTKAEYEALASLAAQFGMGTLFS